MKKIVLLAAWFPITIATLFLSINTYRNLAAVKAMHALLAVKTTQVKSASTPFLVYAALPQTVQTIKTAVRAGDARPVVIDLYLTRYNSPMAGYGEYILAKAEEYRVDPYLFIAIAQQESNLGKKMPSEDCHNAWGYGIHARGTLCFSTWEEGITTVMKGLKEKYIDKGLVNPDEIMRKYTPHSNGSWSNGVEQFMQELTTGAF